MSSHPATPSDTLLNDLLAALNQVHGLHPGFRPVHAKAIMCSGTFTPSPEAATLTRAPHAARPSTPVLVRLSDSGGLPTIPDNDPGASPRGMAIRFVLGEHVHTDIIAHSHDGFPTRTAEEFLELNRAVAASGPQAPKPTPIETFLATHPAAKRFVEAPKPIPTSFAHEAFFAVTAFRFLNQEGTTRHGRFRIRPEAGTKYLTAGEAAAKSPNFLMEELPQRLAAGPVEYHVRVHVAGDGDVVADATAAWPDSRPEMPFGTIALTGVVNQSAPEFSRVIFDPVPRVDGIDPSDDPLIAVRSAVYLLSGRPRRAASAH